jgi:ketosteroid isomerase-like protein
MQVQAIARFYEQLKADDLDRLSAFYSEDARFKDPFNDVTGIAPIRAIFEHMFRVLEAPRFVVRETVQQGAAAFLIWDFHYTVRVLGRARQGHIHGATQLRFADDGRVLLHRDYWDAAEELYEQLPVLGAVLRRLKRRLAVPQS